MQSSVQTFSPSSNASHSLSVFTRREEKYLLEGSVAKQLFNLLGSAIQLDAFGSTRIENHYLDTSDFQLIRSSIEKPDFKEKLRIRTYGDVSGEDHPAFFEIKKKFEGVVYKRRVQMTLAEARDFGRLGVIPLSPFQNNSENNALNRQIINELLWTLERHDWPNPMIQVSYDRCAYTYVEGNTALRVTFDYALSSCLGSWELVGLPLPTSSESAFLSKETNAGSTFHSLLTGSESPCLPKNVISELTLLPKDACLMEIKCAGALPLRFSRILNELGLFPRSFSKVGTAFVKREAMRNGD